MAPRLRRLTGREDVTLFDVLFGHDHRAQAQAQAQALTNRRIAAAIVVFCFLFYAAAQFQAAATAFAGVLGLEPVLALALGAAVIISFTLLGGFLAISYTDMLQGLLILLAALLLPACALWAAGGPGAVLLALQHSGEPAL